MPLVLILFFFGGAALGMVMGHWSGIKNGAALTFFVFPLGFGLAMVSWFWSALALALLAWLHRKPKARNAGLPGSFVAIPICVGCVLVALPIFWFTDRIDLLAGCVWLLCGLLYGSAFWWCGRRGWITPPEEV